jgi:putative glutamine amidotransferase
MIGISAYAATASWSGWQERATLVPQAYVDAVAASGCVPVVLPPVPGTDQVLHRLDGLVLAGGGDIDPARYGAAPHPRTTNVHPARDAAELALLVAAVRAEIPLLGICRGLQLLNVFRRGTLCQHLPEAVGHDGHAPKPAEYGSQKVSVAPDSRTATILGRTALGVHCHHHQAIDRLGAGLTVTAWSDDGVIEAVELTDHPFALAVQWHPEVGEDDSLFRAFADAARTRH